MARRSLTDADVLSIGWAKKTRAELDRAHRAGTLLRLVRLLKLGKATTKTEALNTLEAAAREVC